MANVGNKNTSDSAKIVLQSNLMVKIAGILKKIEMKTRRQAIASACVLIIKMTNTAR
jgi:hypothetical protein